MKKLVFLISLFCFTLTISAQGIQFSSGNWESVLQTAKAQNKLVFIDVFTSWCGPCKHMAKETFTKKSVGDFFNSHFINYRVDAEKGEGVTIAKKYGVHAYPTCMFITSSGEVAYKFLGSKDTIEVMKEAKNALKYQTLMPRIKQMNIAYAQGNRTKAFLKEYVSAMKESADVPGEALTDYMKLMTDKELYSNVGYDYIKSITVFNEALFTRILNHYKKISCVDSLKKQLRFPFMNAISNSLAVMLKPGNEKYESSFERLLAIKDQMYEKNDVWGAMFGGLSYRPSDQLRIYYSVNANIAKYKSLMNSYMSKELKIQRGDSIQNVARILRANSKYKIDSLMALRDTLTCNKIKDSLNFVRIFFESGNKMDANFILYNTEKYWSVTEQNESERQKCEQWILQAYKYYDGLNIAENCSAFLVKLNDKIKARQVLENAIDIAKNNILERIKQGDIDKAENQLKSI
jgi:thioredoxin-related protein